MENQKIIIPFGNKEYEFKQTVANIIDYYHLSNQNMWYINTKILQSYKELKPKLKTDEPIIQIKIYKGLSIADFENFMEGKRKMIKLKIAIKRNDVPKLSKTTLIKYNFINNIDIDVELFKKFFISKLTGEEKKKFLSKLADIIDNYEKKNVDEYLGSIFVPKSVFEKFFQNII